MLRRRSFPGSIGRVFKRQVVPFALKYGARALGNYARNKMQQGKRGGTRQGTSGVSLTNQYDMSWVYRKRRMPRRRRRRWVKSIRRHRAIAMKQLATQTAVRNTADILVGSTGTQAVGFVELYGMAGVASNSYGQSDIKDVLTAYEGGAPSSPRKYIFGSGILDMTLTNQGTDAGPSGTVELDIYRCVYRKATNAPNPVSWYSFSASDLQPLPGGSPLTLSTRGWTPFNCSAGNPLRLLTNLKYIWGTPPFPHYSTLADSARNRYFSFPPLNG